jgi:hypothetical protein
MKLKASVVPISHRELTRISQRREAEGIEGEEGVKDEEEEYMGMEMEGRKGKASRVRGALETHRIVRRRGSHIFCRQSAHR